MAKLVILVLFYFTFPLLIIYMCKKWSVLKKVGSIVIAYGFGLLLGSTGILPEGSDVYKLILQGRAAIPSAEFATLMSQGVLKSTDLFVNQIKTVQDLIPSAVVPLAFPLLLFSLNLRRWLKFAKKGFISVVLALVAGLVMVTTGFFIFKDLIPESWKLAGMFVGIYTGGTPNFVALKMALGVDADLFVLVNTYDMIVGAGLVLFFITLAPKIFRVILPSDNDNEINKTDTSHLLEETEDFEDFSGMMKINTLIPLLKAISLSIVIFAECKSISNLFIIW